LSVMDYESAGVDYDVLDAAKRSALEAASRTITRSSFYKHAYGAPLPQSHGEPAFVFRANGASTLATVLECLGTKSVIARQYADAGGPNLFHHVGFDAVAAIVNDLACVGALPLVINAYFATGSPDWYRDRARYASLLAGWEDGCSAAGAVWGGGESPSLSGLVNEQDIEIAGSAVGFIPPDQEAILGQDLGPGDEIVFISSTGIHTNGASLVRAIAERLPKGYRTLLPNGRELGEAVLDRSALYVELVAELGRCHDVRVTYYSHTTGHGLRKLMRADKELTYRIETLPLPVPAILSEIRRYAGMDDRTAYGTLNMGVGFAVFCAAGHAGRVVDIARNQGLRAALAGRVEDGAKRVILEPLGVTFEEDQLQLRHVSAVSRRAKARSRASSR